MLSFSYNIDHEKLILFMNKGRSLIICVGACAITVGTLLSCSVLSSPEDKLAKYLSSAICFADESETVRRRVENEILTGSLIDEMQTNPEELFVILDNIQKDFFAHHEEMAAAERSIKDPKTFALKVGDLARAKCNAREETITLFTGGL